MSPEINGDFITLARVVKTQGRHGEIAAEIHTDAPHRFSEGMKLFALGEQPARRELEIEELWPHKGLLVFKFRGVDSISDAEVLVGSELQVARADRAELEPGWSYVSDLIGCSVFDHGREIGCIAEVQFGAGEAPLLLVENAGRKFDVPFAEAYLEGVDQAQRKVRMNLPDGMLEINAPMTQAEKEEQKKEEQKKKRN
ncbi:MAG TPA: ribosome maturation factor RimM [Terriglobales bacterium]|nr:ribosome maturation factor RimM [Terriglobales bacterium]